MDFLADGRHLVIDAVMTTVYKNIVLEKVATVPDKTRADNTFSQPISSVIGGSHILVPFAIEDVGRLGAHAQARLRALATTTLTNGRTPSFAKGVE